MPIYHLKPVASLMQDADWRSSPYNGEAWVHAANEDEARGLVSGRYENAAANIPGVSQGPSPWQQPRLVQVATVEEGPNGMDMPSGVVVADRQM